VNTLSDIELLDKFQLEDMFKKVYPKYAVGVGILTVGLMDKNCPEEESEDRCIIVYLEKPLPQDIHLPSVYDGIKVFTEVIGTPKLQQDHSVRRRKR